MSPHLNDHPAKRLIQKRHALMHVVEAAILANHERALARLFARRIILPEPEECWVSELKPDNNGYLKIGMLGGIVYAHRAAYIATHRRPVAYPLELDHLCQRRECFNPDHLEEFATEIDPETKSNAKHHFQMFCSAGHPMEPQNTWISPKGRMFCRACNYRALRNLQNATK